MLKAKILGKLDSLIEQARELNIENMQSADFQKHPHSGALLTTCLAFTKDIVGDSSQFYVAFNNIPKGNAIGFLRYIGETLKQLRTYVDEGWASGIKNLISAEIFDDFLEMAEYFFNEGYIEPAAVITGSVLENHLRDLCRTHGVPISIPDSKSGKNRPVKAEKMNADIVKTGAYNALEQKLVTAWLDLRNKAAHGKREEYDKSQVEEMINGVRGFIVRNPA